MYALNELVKTVTKGRDKFALFVEPHNNQWAGVVVREQRDGEPGNMMVDLREFRTRELAMQWLLMWTASQPHHLR
jgi:hypothetical protein